MRRLIPILIGGALLWPAPARAWPRVTSVELRASEEEVRLVVSIDPADPAPSHRLMRDRHSLRLLLIGAEAEEQRTRPDDQTVRQYLIRHFDDRVVVRIDPRGSPIETLERAEVRPHPRGLMVVIRRSDREAARYRAAHPPLPPEPATSDETEEEEAGPRDEPLDPLVRWSDRDDEDEPGERVGGATPGAASSNSAPPPPPSPAAPPPGPNPGASSPLRAASAAALVVLLAGVAWYLRRRGRGGFRSLDPLSIDIVSAKRIGPRQSLLLVEVGGQTLLIGTTDRGMSRLALVREEPVEGEVPQLEAAVGARPVEESAEEEGEDHLSPLELELRRSLPADGEPAESARSFDRELRSAEGFEGSLSGLLAARRLASEPSQGRETSQRAPDSPSISGLVRLRKMRDRGVPSPAPEPRSGPPARSKGNGRDLSLADLQSLLGSRQAN